MLFGQTQQNVHWHNIQACAKPTYPPTHLPDRGPNPRAVVVKALDAVVVHAAVVCTGRLVDVASVVVAEDDALVVDKHVLGPAQHMHVHMVVPTRLPRISQLRESFRE